MFPRKSKFACSSSPHHKHFLMSFLQHVTVYTKNLYGGINPKKIHFFTSSGKTCFARGHSFSPVLFTIFQIVFSLQLLPYNLKTLCPPHGVFKKSCLTLNFLAHLTNSSDTTYPPVSLLSIEHITKGQCSQLYLTNEWDMDNFCKLHH